MRILYFFIALLLFISTQTLAHANNLSGKDTTTVYKLPPNMDVSVGYVPRSPFHALKMSYSLNNVAFNRWGAYASVEKGMDSDYLAGTLGLTTYVHKYAYLWYGVGIFSTYKSENKNLWSTYRKEMGIGIVPARFAVIRLGWSFTVGPTIAAGIRIPSKITFKKHTKEAN